VSGIRVAIGCSAVGAARGRSDTLFEATAAVQAVAPLEAVVQRVFGPGRHLVAADIASGCLAVSWAQDPTIVQMVATGVTAHPTCRRTFTPGVKDESSRTTPP
jgi:hypothetical protein